MVKKDIVVLVGNKPIKFDLLRNLRMNTQFSFVRFYKKCLVISEDAPSDRIPGVKPKSFTDVLEEVNNGKR